MYSRVKIRMDEDDYLLLWAVNEIFFEKKTKINNSIS